MTGFSNLLRKLFCLPPKQDLWEEARKSRVSLLTPARIKVAVRNERQIGKHFPLDGFTWIRFLVLIAPSYILGADCRI